MKNIRWIIFSATFGVILFALIYNPSYWFEDSWANFFGLVLVALYAIFAGYDILKSSRDNRKPKGQRHLRAPNYIDVIWLIFTVGLVSFLLYRQIISKPLWREQQVQKREIRDMERDFERKKSEAIRSLHSQKMREQREVRRQSQARSEEGNDALINP